MAEVVLGAVSTVAGCLVAPVNRLCGYVISYDSHVCELEDKVAELGKARQNVQDSINDAQNNGKPIKAYVNEWVKDVEKHAEEARLVLDYDGRAKKTCFSGWLPNPKVRYHLGREARRKAKRIQGLINRTPSGKAYDDPPPGRVDGASDMISLAGDQGDTIFDSRAFILGSIMNALDDEEHKVIGIYGPGGVGKTTLLEEVEKKLRKEGSPFGMIVKSKVTQTPDLKNIQDDIAYALSLNLKDEPSEAGRRDLLFKRLQKEPSEKILIILDDLWKEVDLRAVGIPLGDESRGSQVLLTSRYKNVLEQMKCAPHIFHLEGLKNDEAFRLFEKMVGDRLKDNEQLKTIADQVVKKLAGLPLLIISVASFLKDKDECAWRNAQIEIDESNKEKKETIVKLSYNHLKSEDAKTLFLLCGLIGGTIQVETLLVLGMGLGLFKKFRRTMQDSRDRLNTILDELRSACLLLDGGDDKNNVTIHDLYSETVISTPFRGQNSLMMNSNYGSWSKEELEKCWAICLADVDKKRLDELMTCQFPDLQILMLSQPEAWLWMGEHEHEVEDCSGLLDFTYMKELCVLCFHSMHIASFPPSIGILENLHSLYLHDCIVEDVAILGKLKVLQILSFVGSRIFRLPKEIGKLTNLRSLNMSECYLLKIIEPGTLKDLINLEELYLPRNFNQWMGKDGISSESCNAGLAELKSLRKIASLEITILNPSVLLEDDDFPFGNLIKFWINIGNAEGRAIQGLRNRELELEGLRTMELILEEWDIFLSKEWVQKILPKTQYLYLDGLKKFKKNTPELCTEGFRELKCLAINNSPSIEYLANSSNGLPLTAFTILESLFLKNLINLEKICNSLVAPKCFGILKVVTIEQCHRLENLWFLSEMQRLVHLEVLQVRKCDSMRAIITDGAGEIEVLAYDTVELPNLRRLELCELPKMTSFRTSADGAPIQVSLPRLESLMMVGLLGLEEILSSESSLKYNNLKLLYIQGSKSTSSIPKDWILKLPNLESVKIVSCQSTEVVFDLEELKVTGNAEILSWLTKLTLFDLPKLQCMCKQDVQLQGISIFRNLEKLYINNTGLSFLFPVFVAKCLREIRDIVVTECPNMMAIVDEGGRGDGIDDIIKFPLLKSLFMRGCPRVKFFSNPHGKKKSVTTNSDSQDANSDSFFVQKASLPSLDTLDINGCFEMRESLKWIWHSELPESSICKLATVRISNCLKLLNVFPSTIIGKLQNLKEVVIEKCDFLESLFDCGSLDANIEQPTVSLPKLERMEIEDASELRCIVKADSQMILGFPSLKEVCVNNCQKLRYLFPNFIATTLEKLERIRINECDQMKEVVLEKGGGQSKADVLSFPSLRDLSIWNCLNLGAFIRSPTSAKRPLGETAEENNEWSQPFFNEMVTFPNIRSICFGGLQCKELWDNQIPANSFSILKSLGLRNCNNLQRVAPSNIWKRLQLCLEDLKVVSCHSIEIIYEGDGMDTKGSKLRWLYLRDLENLRHIWQSDGLPNILFPNLREIEVVGCSHLETLFPTFTAKFLRQIEELVVNSCENMKLIAEHEKWEEGICTTITFSKLTLLGLFKLPKFRSFLPDKFSLKFPCPEDLEHFPSLRVWSIESCGAEPNQVLYNWQEKQYRERKRHKFPRDQYLEEVEWRLLR